MTLSNRIEQLEKELAELKKLEKEKVKQFTIILMNVILKILKKILVLKMNLVKNFLKLKLNMCMNKWMEFIKCIRQNWKVENTQANMNALKSLGTMKVKAG